MMNQTNPQTMSNWHYLNQNWTKKSINIKLIHISDDE